METLEPGQDMVLEEQVYLDYLPFCSSLVPAQTEIMVRATVMYPGSDIKPYQMFPFEFEPINLTVGGGIGGLRPSVRIEGMGGTNTTFNCGSGHDATLSITNPTTQAWSYQVVLESEAWNVTGYYATLLYLELNLGANENHTQTVGARMQSFPGSYPVKLGVLETTTNTWLYGTSWYDLDTIGTVVLVTAVGEPSVSATLEWL